MACTKFTDIVSAIRPWRADHLAKLQKYTQVLCRLLRPEQISLTPHRPPIFPKQTRLSSLDYSFGSNPYRTFFISNIRRQKKSFLQI